MSRSTTNRRASSNRTQVENAEQQQAETTQESPAIVDEMPTEDAVTVSVPPADIDGTSAAVEVEFTHTEEDSESTGASEEITEASGEVDSDLSSNDRYSRACAEVSRTHKEFISALDAKARYFNVQRVGEAVPVNIPELDELEAEIKATRGKLQGLMAQKRELKTADPELQAIQDRISRARQARNLARAEKMLAQHEAVVQ